MSSYEPPAALTGLAYQPPQFQNTTFRACDRASGTSEVLSGVRCASCGWHTQLPEDESDGQPLFGVADYQHTPEDCAERQARRGLHQRPH